MTLVWTAATTRRAAFVLSVAVCLPIAGCRKRVVVPTLPPPSVKPTEIQPPPPASPSMEGPPPDSITHAPPVKVIEKKPLRRPKKSAKAALATTPPVTTEQAAAPPPPPATTVLGELTTGGDVSPRAQQETADLIASDERRLQMAVAGTKAAEQVTQIKEVRHFLDQAKEVLASGDAEGAKTLATKAKLLIDDLEKWAAR